MYYQPCVSSYHYISIKATRTVTIRIPIINYKARWMQVPINVDSLTIGHAHRENIALSITN